MGLLLLMKGDQGGAFDASVGRVPIAAGERHLGRATHRVPGCVGQLDRDSVAHVAYPFGPMGAPSARGTCFPFAKAMISATLNLRRRPVRRTGIFPRPAAFLTAPTVFPRILAAFSESTDRSESI